MREETKADDKWMRKILLMYRLTRLIFVSRSPSQGMHIPGSPFQFTVGAITDGGAHKVRALGPGLERGEVNKPCE